MRVELLGRPRAHTSHGVVDFVADQRFQLLSYLAYVGDWVTRERASFLFWPDVPSESARTNLRQLLMRVRQLEWLSGLEVDRHRLRWRVYTDVAGLKEAARSSRLDGECSEYRGPLLQDLEGEDAGEFASWLELEREQVNTLWRGSVLERARELTEQGRHGEAAELYGRLLEHDDLDEDALQAYMRAAYHAGYKEQALQRYRGFAKRLEKELDLNPSSASEQLAERIRQAAQATLVESGQVPPVATAVREAPSLPSAPTSFVGRELELSEIAHLLGKPDCRLLTLTGMGGVGKSRLALHAAEVLSASFPDGVTWVGLESLATADSIAPAMAQALDVKLEGEEDGLARLCRYLRSRRALLILDNFEHLLDGGPLVVRLIRECLDLKLLVTSREALNLQEEWRLPLEGFPLPTERTISTLEALTFDAVEVFVARSQKVNPRFTVNQDNLVDVVEICRLVGGLPLGIELAAAWVKMMSPAEIAEQLKENLDVLTARTRNVAERHQSIKATFEHSWSLLTTNEQVALRKLSVFAGGFRLEAARYVANASLPILANLVDKSLLGVSGEGRYERHPLLHEYTKEKLGEHPEEEMRCQDKHLRYYVGLAERAEPELAGPEQASCLRRLAAEHENVRVALNHAYGSHQAEPGLRLAAAATDYWVVRGHAREGRRHLDRLLSLPESGERTAVRAKALHAAGCLADEVGVPEAGKLLDESLAIFRDLGDRLGIADSLGSLAVSAFRRREFATARELLDASLATYRELGNRSGIASALNSLGAVAIDHESDFATARELLDASLATYRELGDTSGVAACLNGLGAIALHHQGDLATARTCFQEALQMARELGEKLLSASLLTNLGLTFRAQGDYGAARANFEESLALRRQLGDRESIARLLAHLGHVSLEEGDLTTASTLFEQGLAMARDAQSTWGIASSLNGLGLVSYAKGDFDAAGSLFEDSLRLSRRLESKHWNAAVLANLGDVTLRREEYRTARVLYEESLATLRDAERTLDLAGSLESFARLAAATGEPGRAARLWGAGESLRERSGAPLPPSRRAEYEQSVASARGQLGDAEFTAAWDEGRAMNLDLAAAYALEDGGPSACHPRRGRGCGVEG